MKQRASQPVPGWGNRLPTYVVAIGLAALPFTAFAVGAHRLLWREVTERTVVQSSLSGRLLAALVERPLLDSVTFLQAFADRPSVLQHRRDPNDRELTLHALRRENLANKILVARDGEEALDMLFSRGSQADPGPTRRLHLILLDLKLPKVPGMEVLREIKSDARLKTVPVVILTSSREDRDLVESYELGVNSYIQKPVEFNRVSRNDQTTGSLLAGGE